MKSALWLAAAALVLAAPAHAGITVIGIEGFGGASIPIVQDDVETGSVFGARVPVSLPMIFTVEPYLSFGSMGDGEFTSGGTTFTREGFDVTSFGVNVALGRLGNVTPFRIFPYVGIGSYSLERGSESIDEVGFNFGLGLGSSPAPTIPLNVNVRGELAMVVTDDTSRKFANVTVGVSYNIFQTP